MGSFTLNLEAEKKAIPLWFFCPGCCWDNGSSSLEGGHLLGSWPLDSASTGVRWHELQLQCISTSEIRFRGDNSILIFFFFWRNIYQKLQKPLQSIHASIIHFPFFYFKRDFPYFKLSFCCFSTWSAFITSLFTIFSAPWYAMNSIFLMSLNIILVPTVILENKPLSWEFVLWQQAASVTKKNRLLRSWGLQWVVWDKLCLLMTATSGEQLPAVTHLKVVIARMLWLHLSFRK